MYHIAIQKTTGFSYFILLNFWYMVLKTKIFLWSLIFMKKSLKVAGWDIFETEFQKKHTHTYINHSVLTIRSSWKLARPLPALPVDTSHYASTYTHPTASHHSVWFLSSHMNLWNSSLPCTVEEEILLEIFELEVTLEPKHWRNFCFLLHSLPWILICDSLLYSLGAKKKKI